MTTQAPTLAPSPTTRRHLMSLAAGPGRPVAAALEAAARRTRDAARIGATAACDAAIAALDAIGPCAGHSMPAEQWTPHDAAMLTVRVPLVAVQTALTVGCRPDALAAYRSEHETAVALARRWAGLKADLIGWSLRDIAPGRVFVRCTAMAGAPNEGRTWAALEVTALAMGAALAVLDPESTPDALVLAQKAALTAVALAGAVTGR